MSFKSFKNKKKTSKGNGKKGFQEALANAKEGKGKNKKAPVPIDAAGSFPPKLKKGKKDKESEE